MATKTFYPLGTLASGSNMLDTQEGGSAPSTGTLTTGWTVGTVAATNYSWMDSQTEQATGTFGGTALPDGTGPQNSIGDCWRSPSAYTGTFDAGTWSFALRVIAVTANGNQAGRIRVRLWRSVNADGSSATEITSGTQIGSTTSTISTSTPQTSTVTFNPGAVTLNGEYLFFQVAWEITTASSAAGGDVLARQGSITVISTPNFAIVVNVALGALTLTGRQASIAKSVPVTLGALTLTGRQASTAKSVPVALGALTLTGRQVSITKSVPIALGVLILTGRQASTAKSVPVTLGALTLTGRQVSITKSVPVALGVLILTPYSITVLIPSAPGQAKVWVMEISSAKVDVVEVASARVRVKPISS